MALIFALIVVALIIAIKVLWMRRRIYLLGNSLPGPFALPIIGNGLKFLAKSEDILTIINNTSKEYPKPLRFWLGPTLLIYFSDPDHIETILSSTKITYKHDVYDMIKIYLGDGLITSSGPKWKLHRKIIQPMLNLKFVTGFTNCFQKHVDLCMEQLEKHVNQEDFDIHDILHNCFIDMIGNSILGTDVGAQLGKNREYIQVTIDIYGLCYERIVKPWLQMDSLYKFTRSYLEQNRVLSILSEFNRNLLKEAYKRLEFRNLEKVPNETPPPIIDQILGACKNNSNAIDDYDLVHHLITLFNASEDTMTIIASFLCLFLGMFPQYQEVAAEEIRTVLGEKPVKVTYEHITKLCYLDMCVKETLRLIPIGPFILRKTTDDFQIGNITYPEGCGIAIGIFEVHRSPKHWENPDTFHPDHFLPEAVSGRHRYAFIPFSAGPRNCIGKYMAFFGIKLMMVNILQQFELQTNGKMSDIQLKSDISVRSKNGYKVRLKRRSWK